MQKKGKKLLRALFLVTWQNRC